MGGLCDQVVLRVKALRHATILLSPAAGLVEGDQLYEIILGDNFGTESTLRLGREGEIKVRTHSLFPLPHPLFQWLEDSVYGPYCRMHYDCAD